MHSYIIKMFILISVIVFVLTIGGIAFEADGSFKWLEDEVSD